MQRHANLSAEEADIRVSECLNNHSIDWSLCPAAIRELCFQISKIFVTSPVYILGELLVTAGCVLRRASIKPFAESQHVSPNIVHYIFPQFSGSNKSGAHEFGDELRSMLLKLLNDAVLDTNISHEGNMQAIKDFVATGENFEAVRKSYKDLDGIGIHHEDEMDNLFELFGNGPGAPRAAAQYTSQFGGRFIRKLNVDPDRNVEILNPRISHLCYTQPQLLYKALKSKTGSGFTQRQTVIIAAKPTVDFFAQRSSSNLDWNIILQKFQNLFRFVLNEKYQIFGKSQDSEDNVLMFCLARSAVFDEFIAECKRNGDVIDEASFTSYIDRNEIDNELLEQSAEFAYFVAFQEAHGKSVGSDNGLATSLKSKLLGKIMRSCLLVHALTMAFQSTSDSFDGMSLTVPIQPFQFASHVEHISMKHILILLTGTESSQTDLTLKKLTPLEMTHVKALCLAPGAVLRTTELVRKLHFPKAEIVKSLYSMVNCSFGTVVRTGNTGSEKRDLFTFTKTELDRLPPQQAAKVKSRFICLDIDVGAWHRAYKAPPYPLREYNGSRRPVATPTVEQPRNSSLPSSTPSVFSRPAEAPTRAATSSISQSSESSSSIDNHMDTSAPNALPLHTAIAQSPLSTQVPRNTSRVVRAYTHQPPASLPRSSPAPRKRARSSNSYPITRNHAAISPLSTFLANTPLTQPSSEPTVDHNNSYHRLIDSLSQNKKGKENIFKPNASQQFLTTFPRMAKSKKR